MEKYIIKYNGIYNSNYAIILHAAPRQIGNFEWRIKKQLTDTDYEIVSFGNGFESITLSTIHNFDFFEQKKGWHIYCHVKTQNGIYDTKSIVIASNFIEAIKNNDFDKISIIKDDGESEVIFATTEEVFSYE